MALEWFKGILASDILAADANLSSLLSLQAAGLQASGPVPKTPKRLGKLGRSDDWAETQF